jgi:hypothetical protein
MKKNSELTLLPRANVFWAVWICSVLSVSVIIFHSFKNICYVPLQRQVLAQTLGVVVQKYE